MLDFKDPKGPFDAALLVADSYLVMCEQQQKQSIESVRFEPPEKPVRIRVYLRHGGNRLSGQERRDCGEGMAVTPPGLRDYNVDFLLAFVYK